MATFIPSISNFQPTYLFPYEYAQYGLPPSPSSLAPGAIAPQPAIDNLVAMASTQIDEYCGRTDGDGNGSLVYTTYQERLLFQAPGRNLTLLPMKPAVGISAATIATLMQLDAASGGGFYTGCVPNTTIVQSTGQLSAIVACSGWYGYTRRDNSLSYPDANALINPQSIISLFGGPPNWIAVDITNTSLDPKTGEIWIPAGLQLQRYSEIIITYNAGYDPRYMPKAIKLACAAIVKNLMLRGGVTGIQGQSLGRAAFNVTMAPGGIIDPDIERLLRAFVTLRAY